MITLAALARAIRARHFGPDVAIASFAIDSRAVDPGSLFVALRGERFDGHDFVDAAFAAGAGAAMVEERAERGGWANISRLVVQDSQNALASLAAWWRNQHDIPVVGIVGSNGKTTAKAMIASILEEAFGAGRVLATSGNQNNHIGVPISLLRMRPCHRVAVLEIGMNHPGETANLAALSRPTVGLINNAQREHMAYMENVGNVAQEHGALLRSLPSTGTAVIDAHAAFAGYWCGIAAPRRVLTFGVDQPASVTGSATPNGNGIDLTLRLPEGATHATLHILGLHHVRNALASAAVAVALGVPADAIGRGLSAFRPVAGRMQLKRSAKGATVIDDSYNANPDSVRAAIDVLGSIPATKVLVIGDMDEMGNRSGEYHEEVGRYARARGIDRLLARGDATRSTVRAFGAGAEHHESESSLIAAARSCERPGAVFLVKGSRFMRMERVVDALVDDGMATRPE